MKVCWTTKRKKFWRYKWKCSQALFLTLILVAVGCRSRVRIPPPPELKFPEITLKGMGFTIQAGAFSILDNAINFTATLNKKGLNAYYFAHESGLYKVRFGNFTSRKAAQKKAQKLTEAGIIEEYYIVSPEEYTVSRRRSYGISYLRNEIVSVAKSFIGMPYSWGGSSPDEGFDCSGLTMAVYQLIGLYLPHSSTKQYRLGTPVRKAQLQKADLVFFATSRGRKVSHVGIYIGDDRFIHAPGENKQIRTDSLSNTYFVERYAGGRTYLK